MRIGAALAACAALMGMLAAPASAGRTQLSVFEDDQQLVMADAATRERALDDLVTLGADTIHSIVFWNRIAPFPLERKRPVNFDAGDPGAYPPQYWDRYDDLVRGATVRGLDLILSPSTPQPLWASRCRTATAKARRSCRPDPTQFKRFIEALGRRYSGEYADENQGGGTLPRVSRWSILNEPNQGAWLSPQYVRRRGRLVPVSPVLYRGLVRAAIKGLRSSGHGSDDVLFGETAPLGRRTGSASTRPMAPGDFLRRALCLDGRGRSLRGRRARELDCTGGFKRLAVTGIAHHPYTRGGSQPPTAQGTSAEITISSAGRLKRIIRQAGARRRVPKRLPIFYTEFGFQTNPPDDIFGVSLARQAEYLNHADYIAWRDPAVASVAQYELRDEANPAAFQTGLRFLDGRPKPGFAAYRLPIWVTRAGSSRVRVWGQLRPAEDDSQEVVTIENDPEGDGSFAAVREVAVTNRKGYFITTVPGARGAWRLTWTPSDGSPTITSRVAKVARR